MERLTITPAFWLMVRMSASVRVCFRSWSSREISAMLAHWSPMRCRSVTIFSAADTVRRSRATGCCCRSSRRQRFSMSRSISSIWRVISTADLAAASSPEARDSTTTSMASSAAAAMSIIS